MKSIKLGNLQRLLTFVLIAIMLIGTVGFAVNGWQQGEMPPNEETPDNNDGIPGDDNTVDTNPPTDNTTPPTDELPPEEIELPKFYNTYTGLETTEEYSKNTPIGFVINPSMPIYGISNSDITIEFPIEDGSTRLLTYTTNDSLLWKVGSLSPTRAFITGMSNFFGGIVISYGNDDIVKYSAWDTDKFNLDLSRHSDCYYIENTLYVYTSKDKVAEAESRNNIYGTSNSKIPFKFSADFENIYGSTEASTVTIPYSQSQKTEFQYSETSKEYLYFKDGQRKIDMLNGKNISFSNLFILFCNATTYEKSEGTELVLDTTSGGRGYYISLGTKTEITWSVSSEGALEFRTLSGEELTVNRGTSYIGYYKASQSFNIIFN